MENQRASDTQHTDALRKLQQQGAKLTGRFYTSSEALRFIRDVAEFARMTPSQLALALNVAPQTVNRWLRKKVNPRVGQLKKLLKLLDEMNPIPANNAAHGDCTGSVPGEAPESIRSLGIHFLDAILSLEVQARDVWILKCGSLREAVRGSIGEAVLEGLRNGTNFHYVFLEGSAAKDSFASQLKSWLHDEKIMGNLIGYCIKDVLWASSLGLTQTPGAWIAIEYSEAQVQRLHRRFDVFKAISVREYTDATRQHVKNEDGQPCWIELATPYASVWMEALNDLRAVAGKNRGGRGVNVIRPAAEKRLTQPEQPFGRAKHRRPLGRGPTKL